MDLQNNLIECNPNKNKGGWKASCASMTAHALMLLFVIYLGTTATKKVDAEEKPIRAYISQAAAPPPPPPPPPPAPAASSAPKSATPKAPKQVTQIHIAPVHTAQLTPPRVIPKEVPKPDPTPTPIPEQHVLKIEDATQPDPQPQTSSSTADSGSSSADDSSSNTGNNPAGVLGGVAGGVAGGVPGGVVGGEAGGVVGGTVGGEKGGVLGGKVGGKVGGTGEGDGDANGNSNAKSALPTGPVRVGGDVKAPVIISKFEPKYSEAARAARISGIVIVEAVINRNGDVEEVHVIKGLPMGLSEQAESAVRQWKFRPGTMNGQPVDVIFNLTVNFKMN